jgi:hypothetical protein
MHPTLESLGNHQVASSEQWLPARKELLER